MIVQLTGVVAAIEGNGVVVDVGGVGYLVQVPLPLTSTLEVGAKAILRTHMVARVQPDFDMALYGFADATELSAFRILLGAQGVGPKVALAFLSTLTVAEIARALSTSDTRLITKVPGVGPKLASKLCLELGDKMAVFAFEQKTERSVAGAKTAQENAAYEDALEGLVGFGYSRADARRAADRALATVPDKTDAGALITAALALLSSGK